MSITSEKSATLTSFKDVIAQCLRENLEEYEIYDSLDEVSPDLLPCVVLSFDKGVHFEVLTEDTYEAKASLSVDLFLGISEDLTIKDADSLSEMLVRKLLKRLKDACQSILLDEVSAQNIPGENKMRILMHDFTLQFLWSPNAT